MVTSWSDGQDFYEILGVSQDADSVTIRNAFKKLALTHHPDKVSESQRAEAEVKFKIISEAYETLSNEEARMLYDAQADFDGQNWQDFYDGPSSDYFEFGTQSPRFQESTSNINRTEDAVFEIMLSLDEVFSGKMLKLKTQRKVLCHRCQGTGGRNGASKRTCSSCKGVGKQKKTHLLRPGIYGTSTVNCDVCHGEGKVFSNRDLCGRCKGVKTQDLKSIIEVYVPKGVKNRHKIVVEGQSDEEPGKQTGDLVILILVNEYHPVFHRKGADIYATTEISLKEALTGFSRGLITHMDGRTLKVTISRGNIIKPGSIIKIPGEGLTIESTLSDVDELGDLYLQVDVQFPDSIDRHILDELAPLLDITGDDCECEKSDDTLDESGYANNSQEFTSAYTQREPNSKVFESDYEILQDNELPEYSEDVNDVPEPTAAEHQSSNDNSSYSFEYPWGSQNMGGTPGCKVM